MNADYRLDPALDLEAKRFLRWGAVSAFFFGIGYIVIMGLYLPLGAPPDGAEARLAYMAGNSMAWWGIVGLSILTDFLLIPVTLSLCLVMRKVNRYAMLLAAVFMGLFVVLDLALTWPNYATLITLSGSYGAALNDSQRAALVAAAVYPVAVLESTLLDIYNTLTLSVGILIYGCIMLRGLFNKTTASLGVVTGALGILAVAGPFFHSSLSLVIIIASVLTTVWVILVGYGLYQLSRL